MKLNLGKMGKKLLWSNIIIGIIFILLVLTCLLTIVFLEYINNQKQQELRELDQSVHHLIKTILNQETGQLEYHLSGETNLLTPFYIGTKEFKDISEVLMSNSIDPEIKTSVKEAIEIGSNCQVTKSFQEIKRKNDIKPSPDLLNEVTAELDNFRIAAENSLQKIEDKSQVTTRINHHRMVITLNVLMLLAIGIIIINFLINIKFIKSIVKPIMDLNSSVRAYASNDFSAEPPIYIKEKNELSELVQNVDLMRGKLSNRMTLLQSLADVDGLTGIYNRRYFNKMLEAQWKKAKENAKKISLILFDIDFFKKYNDTYGHLKGDDCLRIISQKVKKLIHQEKGVVARYGGEEFAILLYDCTENDAVNVAERVRAAISDLKLPHINSDVTKYVTLSVGIASIIPKNDLSSNYLIALSDQALYQSKINGRNQVVKYK